MGPHGLDMAGGEPTLDRLAINLAYDVWRLLGDTPGIGPAAWRFRAARTWFAERLAGRRTAGPVPPAATLAADWTRELVVWVAGSDGSDALSAETVGEIASRIRAIVADVDGRDRADGSVPVRPGPLPSVRRPSLVLG